MKTARKNISKAAAICTLVGGLLTSQTASAATLIAYWPFEDSLTGSTGAGLNAFVGGSDFDLNPINGANVSADRKKFGNTSASFDRNQSQHMFTDSGAGNMIEQGSSFSYSVWYYLDVADITGSARYFVLESTASDVISSTQSHPISLGLRDLSDGNGDIAQVYTSVGNSSDQHYEFSTPTQEWVNVITTYDSVTDTLNSYINGTLVSRINSDNEQVGTTIDAGNGLVIGGHRGGTGRNFDGFIDDVAVWDGVISSSEISRIQSEPVVAIPEPSGVILGFVGLVSGALSRRRKMA